MYNPLLYILQGAMYGLVVGGIRGARIWFGPLPSEICYIQLWATNVNLNNIFHVAFQILVYLRVETYARYE